MVVLTSLGPPSVGVKHVEELTSVYINTRSLGRGTLYISESRVSWVGDTSGQGFSLEYPHIALHAISKDLSSFHSECLYCMIDVRLVESEGTPTPESSDIDDDAADGDADDGNSGGGMTEVRFVPENKSMLDSMFKAMSDCQSLHPDPEAEPLSDDEGQEPGDGVDEEEDEDEEEGMYDDADEEGEYDVAQAEESAARARGARRDPSQSGGDGNPSNGDGQEPMEDQ